MASSAYANVRAAIADEGSDARVEVNQRALIDKILARYASNNAVYRELLQNSNDAEATTAEIIITTSSNKSSSNNGKDVIDISSSNKEVVTQVIYRNNGLPFRTQDWARLRKIAEGNPDESKVGAFGVGAYTMFSICEEPLVVSGKKGEEEAMAFFWKGDGLWTKTGKAPEGILNMSASLGKSDDNQWTSFILPSRDPYQIPDMVEFGQFLSASLTFTQCLKNVRVYVNQTLVMNIEKTILESHTIATPKASSWWKNDGSVTTSSTGMFTFGKGSDLTQTSVQMNVSLRRGTTSEYEMDESTVRARYASAQVKTSIPSSIEKRMVRVTKKKPPKELTVQIFLDAANEEEEDDGKSNKRKMPKRKSNKRSRASLVTDSFAPTPGSGRIFIGFRTSQTTGLGIHLAAPLLPTVEREAIDFVDAALRDYNSELLEMSGMLMRLALEHEMGRIGALWDMGKDERDKWEAQREEEKKRELIKANEEQVDSSQTTKDDTSSKGKDSTSVSSSLLSFASFMAKGVKSTVTEALKPVQEILGEDNETAELLNPRDDRPLCLEERDAILLMQAYCPRQSTPDSLVGQCLAKGFSRCLQSSSPPVLTQGGVMRGSEAKLPNYGLEAYGFNNVVRRIMLENAQEYHSVIANVKVLIVDDLISSLKNQILDQTMLVRLLKWWPKFCRRHSIVDRHTGLRLKEAIRFELNEDTTNTTEDEVLANVHRLDSILYFTPKHLLGLPLPETSFPPLIQDEVGLRILENSCYNGWFSTLPFDIWTSFISQHPCMVEGKSKELNILALAALSMHFDSLDGTLSRRRFIELLPISSPCIPYDTDSKDKEWRTGIPNELYMSSSNLEAFAGVGVFNKVSKELKVSDAFLIAMGVRTTISIDFLFLHLDTLRWNNNPKPLITYLIDADLSHADLQKLRSTKYLPAEQDETHVYAPKELYIKNSELEIFPFIRFLQWRESEGMSKAHRDFLIKLGVKIDPPLSSVMSFLEGECNKSEESRDDKVYEKALQYLANHLGPQGGIYEREFAKYKSTKFLPCIRQNLETGDIIKEMQSPSACYYNPSSLIMGFSTLDPQLDTVHIATRTKCLKDPSCKVLIIRLLQLVEISKAKIEHFEKQLANNNNDEERRKLGEKISTLFDAVFAYLATRTSDFAPRDADLSKQSFIPCKTRGQVVFYLPSQIFFKSNDATTTSDDDSNGSLTGSLFQQIKYNAFLSLAGVKEEPSLQEIFNLMIEKPDEVLDSLGEDKYKALLRRVAANPPFKSITKQIRQSPFLLGYLVIDEEISSGESSEEKDKGQKAQYVLARADDIYIVDNSFLRRQFSMLVAPMEQTLEEFYNRVGSKYVSQVVKKDYEVSGRTYKDTALTKSMTARLLERKPLLLSPTNSSRPLASNAAKILDEAFLEVVQAENINAKYSFERSSKKLKVTCCTKQHSRQKTTIYITTSPDWFDVASAVGALILQRCQLEDALLLSQLLESPLETLRYRGFPVDRILRPVSKPQPPPPPQPQIETNKKVPPEDSTTKLSGLNGSMTKQPQTKGQDGFEKILQQMFPSCPPEAIQGLLGPNPTKEKAREVANMLAAEMPPNSGNGLSQTQQDGNNGNEETDDDTLQYSDDGNSVKDESTIENNDTKVKSKKKKSSGLMKMMSKMGLPGSHMGIGGGKGHQACVHGASRIGAPDSNTPSSPERDASTQQSLESMLNQAVQSSRSVDHAGVRSQETLLNSLPQGLDRGEGGCEVIPAQNIHAFQGPHGNYKSRNGIKIFSTTTDSGSLFLSQNFHQVERFSIVIQNLAKVFKLNLSTVAIYYEPNGSTIAFNRSKALYFNLRFFVALHQNSVDSSCYSYWFMTFAHELAHNLVTAHNKEHGSFTESIAALYLPDFVRLLSQI